MIKLGIVGTGHIFKKQIEALDTLGDKYQLIAVCDSNTDRLQSCGVEGVKRYTRYQDMFFDNNVDAVLISTPPSTHYEISKAAIFAGKKVLLEKPAVLQLGQLEELYALAEEQNAFLQIAFHASFAKDLHWYLAHRSEFEYAPIRRIICEFYDPYMANGSIRPESIALKGCHIDSGVNALSVCEKLVSLDKFNLADYHAMSDDPSNGITYQAEHLFKSDSCEIIIKTAWNKGLNLKRTTIQFETIDARIELNHSQQKVILISGDMEKTLYFFDEAERLFTHYCGVFNDFYRAVSTRSANKNQAYEIHRLLLSCVEDA